MSDFDEQTMVPEGKRSPHHVMWMVAIQQLDAAVKELLILRDKIENGIKVQPGCAVITSPKDYPGPDLPKELPLAEFLNLDGDPIMSNVETIETTIAQLEEMLF